MLFKFSNYKVGCGFFGGGGVRRNGYWVGFGGILKIKTQRQKQPRLEGAWGGHLDQSPAQSRSNSEVSASSLHPEAKVLRSSPHLPFWPAGSVTWRQNLCQWNTKTSWGSLMEREGSDKMAMAIYLCSPGYHNLCLRSQGNLLQNCLRIVMDIFPTT